MPHPNTRPEASDCLLTTILGFLLPFFLTAAAGDPDSARAAVIELIDAYNSSTPTELDLVGRIIGFSIAAMDNLRLSMTPGLSDTKVLRYRSNAVTLSRASDQAQKILESLQANQQPRQQIPRPTVAAAPTPEPAQPEPAQPKPAQPEPAQPAKAPVPTAAAAQSANHTLPALTPTEIETMKRDARILMNTFSKSLTQATTLIPTIPSPATLVSAAVKAAMPSRGQSRDAQPPATFRRLTAAPTGTRC